MNEWYYWKSGKQHGPISLETLRGHIVSGDLNAANEIWRQGTPDWVPLRTVPEVADLLPRESVAAPAWTPAPTATQEPNLELTPSEPVREVSRTPVPTSAAAVALDSTHLLTRAARSDLYRVNAFRVTELPVDATDRELTRKLDQLKLFEKLGEIPATGGGIAQAVFGSKPGAANQQSADAIREAAERLRDPEVRLVDEFFWFWPNRFGESRGDPGLAALAGGAEQATAIWSNQNGSDGGVARHNLAVLNHARALELEENGSGPEPAMSSRDAEARDEHWVLAMRNWRRLIDDDAFWDKLTERIRDLNEPQLPPSMARQMRIGLPRILLTINAQLAVRAAESGMGSEATRLLGYVDRSGFDPADIDEVLRQAVHPLRERIRMLCQSAIADTNLEPEKGDKAARLLYEQACPVLKVLEHLLPWHNPLRQDAGDELAMGILACQVPFGQKTNDWKTSLELVQLALPLAGSESGRGRLEQEVTVVQQTLQSWEDYRKLAMCWFCQKEPGAPLATLDVPMYGNITKEWFGTGYQLRWQWVQLKVARCAACRSAHRKRELRTLGWATLGGLVGLGVHLLVYWLTGSWLPGLFLISGGLLAGGIFGDRRSHNNNCKLGIKPLMEKKKHPEVLRLQGQGWLFGTKPPTG